MADNNTFVLFEEIKNKLETIYRELKELKEKENNSVSLPVQSTPAQTDEQKEQKLLNQYEQRTKDVINSILVCKCASKTRRLNLWTNWWQVS